MHTYFVLAVMFNIVFQVFCAQQTLGKGDLLFVCVLVQRESERERERKRERERGREREGKREGEGMCEWACLHPGRLV